MKHFAHHCTIFSLNPFVYIKKQKRIRIANLLKTIDPYRLEQIGEKKLISSFHRAAQRVPAYRVILNERGIDPSKITDYKTFREVIPETDKSSLFGRFPLTSLCIDGNLDHMKLAMTSSGFSGTFSFGITSRKEYRSMADAIDTSMQLLFNTDKTPTFLINCFPMGIHMETSLPMAETGVRWDMALKLLETIGPRYEQTLIAGDPHFLKRLIEEGCKQKIDWKGLNTSFITGGDWLPESLRSYMADRASIEIDSTREQRSIISTMGLAELGLNLFHETRETIRIRRNLTRNNLLRQRIDRRSRGAVPILFHYYPTRIHLEKNEKDELIISMLSKEIMTPFMRYNSHDRGNLFSYHDLVRSLEICESTELIPSLKLPLCALMGRTHSAKETKRGLFISEDIKEGLYEDHIAAAATTGYFRILENEGEPELAIQLQKGVVLTDELRSRFHNSLFRYTPSDCPVSIYSYEEFPFAMELDFNQKFYTSK